MNRPNAFKLTLTLEELGIIEAAVAAYRMDFAKKAQSEGDYAFAELIAEVECSLYKKTQATYDIWEALHSNFIDK